MPVGTPADVRLEATRALMMERFDGAIQFGLDNLVLPGQQEAFLVETAHFVVFLLSTRMCDLRRQPPELRNLMQGFRTLHKTMERDVAGQFVELQNAFRAGEAADE